MDLFRRRDRRGRRWGHNVTPTIATVGIAVLVDGAISTALGEYVPISSQTDSQRALIEKERAELAQTPRPRPRPSSRS